MALRNPYIPPLEEYLNTKEHEQSIFDPSRAVRIYEEFKKHVEVKARIIHIIGTNGKGSTGRFLSFILGFNAKSYLHFTSPHIFEFKERFYLPSGVISSDALELAHQHLARLRLMDEASYFEYATFLALYIGKDMDYIVLEAGLGGEFDSTNVMPKALSIFTKIDFDHEERLGRTIEEIAGTKLRAISAKNIMIIQEHEETHAIAQSIAKSRGASLKIFDTRDNKQINIETDRYFNNHDKYAFFLKDNLSLALFASLQLHLNIINLNIGDLNIRGRCEQLTDNIILDVGHNVLSARVIKQVLGNKKVKLIYNSYYQKNIKEILSILKSSISIVEIIEVDNPRIIKRNLLENILNELNIPFKSFNKINEEDNYLVFGSFSVIMQFLKYWDDVCCFK